MKKKKFKFFFSVFIFFSINSPVGHAQYWNWAEQAIGNDWSIGYNLTTDANNNVYVCGFFIDSARFGNFDVYGDSQTGFVVKYDANGNADWVRTFPAGTGSSDWSFTEDIAIDQNNDVILYGRFKGTITAGSHTLISGNEDIFLIKLDKNGNFIWSTQSNSSNSDFYKMVLTTDIDNNIYIGAFNAFTTNFGNLTADKRGYFIVKYDKNGTPLMLINESNCQISSINVSTDKKIYLTAEVYDTTTIGVDSIIPSGYYYYIYNFNDTDTVYGISAELLFVCYDSTALPLWNRMSKSISSENRTFSTLDVTSNLYVTGIIEDTTDFWGTTLYNSSLSTRSTFLLKIDSLGNIVWQKTSLPISQNAYLLPKNIKVKDSLIVITGGKGYRCSFLNLIIDDSNSHSQSFIILSDTAGNGILESFDSTSNSVNLSNSIALGQGNSIHVCGYFEDSLNLGNNHLESFGNGAPIMFVAKLTTLPVGINEDLLNTEIYNINIFPNPATGQFKLTSNSSINKIIIRNSSGQIIQNISVNKLTDFEINLENQGMYFIQVFSDKEPVTKKVIVMN